MNNIILSVLSVFLCFTMVLVMEKIFKKDGLYIWIALATVMANILVCKTINLFGVTSTLGNVTFGSIFLALDILTEKYGKEEADKATDISLFTILIFTFVTQYALLYTPDTTDIVNDSLKTVFSLNLRVNLSSIVMFYLSSKLNIFIYNKLNNKFSDKLWIKNNLSTIVSNCTENYFFAFFAFIGIYEISTIITIATISSLIEIIIALLDTPFIYLAKKNK